MSTKPTLALATFANSYNCSQSVFCVFAPDFGINKDLSLRLAGLPSKKKICFVHVVQSM